MAKSSTIVVAKAESEVKLKLKKPIVVKFPRRKPSIGPLVRPIIFITPDKTTCAECICYQNQKPYIKKPKLRPCLQSPRTLYELTAEVVDSLFLPAALKWSVENVARWMDVIVGLPQYVECIFENKINGMRLLFLEQMSNLPKIGIKDYDHMKYISTLVHKLYSTEFIKFARSIGLPHRFPLTYCTWFNARTGPSWGIHQNWTSCDLLRWMKIIDPEPVRRNHWDLVWYQKPDFPKNMFARIKSLKKKEKVPRYRKPTEYSNEYEMPRLFHLSTKPRPQGAPASMIWMERVPGDPLRKDPLVVYPEYPENIPAPEPKVERESRLMRKKLNLSLLTGKDFVLARRVMPKQKFNKIERPLKKKKTRK